MNYMPECSLPSRVLELSMTNSNITGIPMNFLKYFKYVTYLSIYYDYGPLSCFHEIKFWHRLLRKLDFFL